MKTKMAGVALAAVMAFGWAGGIGRADAAFVPFSLVVSGTFLPQPNSAATQSGSFSASFSLENYATPIYEIDADINFGNVYSANRTISGSSYLSQTSGGGYKLAIYTGDNFNKQYSGFEFDFLVNPPNLSPQAPYYTLDGNIISVLPSSFGQSTPNGNATYTLTITDFQATGDVPMSVAAAPLPASAPLFGAALLALAGIGWTARRRPA